jgi:hypothetical protein
VNANLYSYVTTALLALLVTWFLTSRYYRWRLTQVTEEGRQNHDIPRNRQP